MSIKDLTKKNLKEAITKEPSSILELKAYLQKQVTKWRGILNSNYKTDSGESLENHAKGKMEAYIETLSFLEKLNDK